MNTSFPANGHLRPSAILCSYDILLAGKQLSEWKTVARIFRCRTQKCCGVSNILLPSKLTRREGTSGTTPSPVQHTADLFYFCQKDRDPLRVGQ
jgi:hypothetical protein